MHPIPTYILSPVFLLTGMLAAHSLSAAETTAAEPAVAAQLITVQSGSVGGFMRLGGSVEPEHLVNLTAQMPGDVSFVGGSEGDAFKAGEALIKLDDKSLMAKREQALTQLASAEAGYRNAQVQYNLELNNPNSQSNSMLGGAPSLFSMFSDPMRSMMGQGSPGLERGSNLYGRQVQVETAANSVAQAKAALREIDEAIKNSLSVAPFDGVILQRQVERGDIVQPGMPLVSFADVTKLQIRIEVPNRMLPALKQQHQFNAYIDGLSTAIKVEIDRIFPMADAAAHTTTVKFNLPSHSPAHSGLYAEVAVPIASQQSAALPTIPASAIVWRGSLPAVYKVLENGQVKLRLIRIDEADAMDQVSVISGIEVGDNILAQPQSYSRTQQ